jgi:PAS domain S-box-containing protein
VTTLAPVAFYDFEIEHGETERIVPRSMSPMIARMVGLEPDEFLRDPQAWLRSIHPDDRDAVTADALDQLRSGHASTRSYRVIGPTGAISWVRSESRCVERDEQGRPARIQGAIVDVTPEMTEVERARRSEETLRTFVDGIPGAPWIEVQEGGPGTGRIVFLGPQVEELLGFSADELIAEAGHSLRIVHPDDRERVTATWRRHERTGEPYNVGYRALHRDGRAIRVREVALSGRDERGRLVWYGVTYAVTPQVVDPPELIVVEAEPDPERLPGRG